MHKITTEQGITVSFEKLGSGPPLVLVHGAFSNHHSNWEFVMPSLAEQFTVYAIARRGRGETDVTLDQSVEAEGQDVAEVIRAIGEPVVLVGHSYGALVALEAADLAPDYISKLVLYEPPRPNFFPAGIPEAMLNQARAKDWDGFSFHFFHEILEVPAEELEAMRATELWTPILEDANASLGDFRAIAHYDFRPERFSHLVVPVLLQVGSESPKHLYATGRLAAALPNARIESFKGQSHDGMTTAPHLYVESISAFCTEGELAGVG